MEKVYRIYLQEGPDAYRKMWWREFGIDYPTFAEARIEKAQYQASFPDAKYFIRAANPRQ